LISAEIAEAFYASCCDEIEAPKPGNVHIFADGHGMTVADFLASARAAAGPLAAAGASVGARILGAVEATFAAAGMNTNLGILLLCAPLAMAAGTGGSDLQVALKDVLSGLDRADADQAFRAIRLANPGGLGEAPRYDVRGAAEVSLLEAMAEAAERDRIALQYVTNFRDVFATGTAALEEARRRGLKSPWPTAAVYLNFLAAFPDTHVTRKHGLAAAREIQREAQEMLSILEMRGTDCLNELLSFDRRLKSLRRNPGTSADLTVATLFADRLHKILLKNHNDA